MLIELFIDNPTNLTDLTSEFRETSSNRKTSSKFLMRQLSMEVHFEILCNIEIWNELEVRNNCQQVPLKRALSNTITKRQLESRSHTSPSRSPHDVRDFELFGF